jgi:hypothetical protein
MCSHIVRAGEELVAPLKVSALEVHMQVHFTFNEGFGVQHDGTHEFKDIAAAKAEAILFLAQSLQDDGVAGTSYTRAAAALDDKGKPLFTVSMNISINDAL